MTTPIETTLWSWRHEQGQSRPIQIPILDSGDDPHPIEDWTVDAKIRTRPGGDILHTFPAEYAELVDGGANLRMTIPAPVSLAWVWTTGWYRIKVAAPVTDLDYDPDNPTIERIIHGPFILDAD